MELNIEVFSPKKNELIDLAKKYQDLKIIDINDKDGYKIVDVARKDLKTKRVEIQKTGKDLRAEAVAFQKRVIAVENELVSLIEPIEKDLQTKQEHINNLKIKQERLLVLPERLARLEALNINLHEDFILEINDMDFDKYINNETTRILQEKMKEQEIERAKLVAEQQELVRQKELVAAMKKAEEDALALAERKRKEDIARLEQEKQKAIDAERKKAEEEKIALIKAQQEAEQKRLDEERWLKEKEEEEAQAREKFVAYQTFLKDNNFDKETFKAIREGNFIVLYKKVASFDINTLKAVS